MSALKTTTLRLANYICDLDQENIPASTYENAKKCILDLFAASVVGLSTPAARAASHLAKQMFAPGKASVWFSNQAFSPPGAAFLNSVFASALDLDDGHRSALGHPGASIIPAALAVAQESAVTGRELLVAIIIGYEIAVRVSAARDHSIQETLATGRWCAFGAAAAGGYLKKQSPKVLAEALGVAGVHSPDLKAAGYSKVMGNSAKEGIPWGTLTGLSAVWLANSGFTGPTDILDHPDYYDHSLITKNLGQDFAIESVYFKPYGCCRWIHSALDAVNNTLAENQLKADLIDRIEVHTFSRALRSLTNDTGPDTIECAQYSIPFCIALVTIIGTSALLPIHATLLGRRDIVDFAEKVDLYVDETLDQMFPNKVPARIIIHSQKGTFERLVTSPLGDPSNPMDMGSVRDKFRTLALKNYNAQCVERIITATERLDKNGLDDLTKALCIDADS
ncbi:MAG: MmgE/PrpD family protein [Desulfobacteraceae bacterium]|nr:MmgE/PrpD family protein [Desulfobacteraceae bacterium]